MAQGVGGIIELPAPLWISFLFSKGDARILFKYVHYVLKVHAGLREEALARSSWRRYNLCYHEKIELSDLSFPKIG